MSNWKVMKLSEVATIVGGGTPSSSKSEYFENGNIPWITPKDLSGYNKRYISKGERNITELGLKNSSAKLLPKNTVLLTSRAPIGYIAIASNEISTNQGFKSLVLNDGHIPEFFYYLLKNNVHILESRATGSTFKEISGQILKDTELSIPTPDIQQKIVDILSPLDDKIELNTQINQTLEQIAQALFKSWFVDFDPVRAKVEALSNGLSLEQAELAAMQTISGKTPEELTALSQTQPDRYAELAETAKAFPCEMVEVDGVDVPKGWELSTIGEEVETVGGATPSTKEESFWNNGKIAWTTPKDLSSATSPVLINTERKITELGLKKISSGLLPISTVLLSSRAPIGYLALTKIPVAINQGYIAIKCNKTLSNFYMLQWCKENLEEIKSRASGTTFLEISKTTFRGISIIVPEKNILIMFNKQCESIYEIITNHTKENQKLEKVRDLLLPRLLNGEIQL
ncbi:restriction endonuclease subunit S [Haemophilus influenzae]|uniref:restriction endonuclease subunit S n=1 Tax=Haemophilus influenzae TaxID=727 RepID=UPI000E349DDA|nr:restriction endonuclease subunit S [Haemophilus influenzae]MCK9642996.1 restriction endonuclease subunit S [Haemophilus influenzae]MCK9662494.1 restriction endonuclease subunit S [Haemophilus influenzae]RFN91336.1 restriction endonuclease subunit S [Haemophilus influenzae]